MRRSIITWSVITWLVSSAILTSGALLAALAENVDAPPRDRSIEPRAATGAAYVVLQRVAL